MYHQRNLSTEASQSKERREHVIPVEKLCEDKIRQLLHGLTQKTTNTNICQQFTNNNMAAFIYNNQPDQEILAILVPACTATQDNIMAKGFIEVCYNITKYLQGASTSITRFHTWFVHDTAVLSASFHKQINSKKLLASLNPQDIEQEILTLKQENASSFALQTNADGWAAITSIPNYTILMDPTTNPDHFKWIACHS